MNPLELSRREIDAWDTRTQAIAKLGDAHFATFNDREAARNKRLRERFTKALGTLQRAAAHLRKEIR